MPDGLSLKKTRTTCPYCGVGCGIVATDNGDGQILIAGDPEHPANKGRLCGKGAALGETLGLDGRLLQPTIGGRQVGWRLGGGSYQSAPDPRLHFGLGEAGRIESVEVRWPGGRVDRIEDLPADAGYLLREGESGPLPLPGFAAPGGAVGG